MCELYYLQLVLPCWLKSNPGGYDRMPVIQARNLERHNDFAVYDVVVVLLGY